MLLRDEHFQFDEQGRLRHHRRQIYRILNDRGIDSWSTIDRPWSAWFEKRPVIRARVISPAGVATTLNPDDITEATSESANDRIYSDQRRLQAPLPAIEIGSVVELESIDEQTRPFSPSGAVHRVPLIATVPTRLTRVTLEWPSTLAVRTKVHGSDVTPRTENSTSGRKLLLEIVNPKVIDEIEYDPFWDGQILVRRCKRL
jgi:hypothetical protein